MSILLVDIGGTKIRLALTGRTIVRPEIVATPKRWSKIEAILSPAIKRVTHGQKITRIIGGVPGTLDDRQRVIRHASNLSGWNGHSLFTLFSRLAGTKNIIFHNDANLAGLGEAVYGAGRGYAIVAYLGIGTGVGGTRIVNKKLDLAPAGFRPGHHILDADAKAVCACGQHGDLESLVSGSGLRRQYGQPAENLSASAYRRAARYLGLGLNNISVLWSPDVIILGGSVMTSLWPFRKTIQEQLRYRLDPPRIIRGRLGDMAGLYGALALAQE